MKSKHLQHGFLIRVVAMAVLLTVACGLTSCRGTWDWLWSRDSDHAPDTNDLILGGEDTVAEEYEGAVEYDSNKKHSGTEIYYINQDNDNNPNRYRIIVIDAGHQQVPMNATEPNGPGSSDMKAGVASGATGVSTGQHEYDLNLQVAIALRDVLYSRGYSVVMIRETNNVTISNMERARIANKYNAAAYIRIHANGSEDSSTRGAMTICQSRNNPYETCTAHYEQSRLLSEMVLNAFCETTGFQQHDVAEMDHMTGTNWSEVPTTIVEMGFLSNPSEDEFMATGFFQGAAAAGIASGLDTYFDRLDAAEQESEESEDTPLDDEPSEPAAGILPDDAPIAGADIAGTPADPTAPLS